MSTISQILKSRVDRCALIPFITAGYPNIEITESALRILDHEGADIIELGLPYSDPLADGPIIQEASKHALSDGMTFNKLLELLDRVNGEIKAPLVLFTYYNPILARGIEVFLEEVSCAGIKGLIVPDLPLEEADYVISLCTKFSLELILLVTPASPTNRIAKIVEKAQNIIYVVSSTGVTGLRSNINLEMKDFIHDIKSVTSKSLILGFGISNADHVSQISRWEIDGIVIGSAFVKCLMHSDYKQGLDKLQIFCRTIKESIIERSKCS
uniref:Tryptophan synthase alpha chain n=1 Tax=Scinaia undulata TaxID=1884664 RepID=A0A1G4NXF8_9FLOR|nr:Tryptophan synthase alpha subunit [Scinaia undulata]SCW23337.1 Tryptophan synthase alpha subunit [Scinaia undulata]